MRIEDYGLIGDLETAALVGRDGSVDWLCLPRFDSPACFAALLGDERNGHWRIAPADGSAAIARRYRPGTLILETEFETSEGTVRLVDFMPPRAGAVSLVRIVEGVRGRVPLRLELAIRLDYGSAIPWVTHDENRLNAVLGPDALRLVTPVEVRGEDMRTVADVVVGEGDRVPFTLDWHPSHLAAPEPTEPFAALAATEEFWESWSDRCSYHGEWEEPVTGSLRVLKALTYAPTGAIVAAPTTSLPESLGGVRNWDYRFCWIRDAALALYALLDCGYGEEALAFRDWLLRATAGDARQYQIMYGVAGERRLPELVLEHLPGYEGARPVRVGNAAADQFQLDTFGELLDAAHMGRTAARALGIPIGRTVAGGVWKRHLTLMDRLEEVWSEPDEGIWEVRGPRRHFTYSKVMAWVGFDRAVKAVEQFGLEGPAERWKRLRAELHDEICREGYDADRGTFTQYYGSRELDASLLKLPLVGFLPPSDERIRGTVEAVERELIEDGLVLRYRTGSSEGEVDGLPGREGAFLACSFWLAAAQAMVGRQRDARALFERLLGLRNDLGLLSEEYDPESGRLLGNFPQAFSHLALIEAARRLEMGQSD